MVPASNKAFRQSTTPQKEFIIIVIKTFFNFDSLSFVDSPKCLEKLGLSYICMYIVNQVGCKKHSQKSQTLLLHASHSSGKIYVSQHALLQRTISRKGFSSQQLVARKIRKFSSSSPLPHSLG